MSEPNTAAAPPAAEPSLPQILSGVLQQLPGLVSDRVHLLALELRRAGVALSRLLMLGAAALVFAATAWLALCAGLTAALLATGLAWGWALLTVLVLNGAAAALAAVKACGWARQLGLPATLRHLTAAPSTPATGAPHDHH
nr:phage holin family protein [uncultured Roseateles sp.]